MSLRQRALAFGATALLACSASHAQPWCDAPTARKQAVLQSLGWQFVAANDAAAPTINAGTPCDRDDLAQAHAAGDLRVSLPGNIDAAARAALLDTLLDHPATHCAYAFLLGDATRRAVDKLVANPRYRFSALQLGWIGFGAGGAQADGWLEVRSFGRGYRPAGSNMRAIEGFYRGAIRSECGVSRQIAQLATQAELYGAAAFDQAFDAEELTIGTFNQLHGTRSILLGSEAGEFQRDGRARRASRDGQQAFAGLPGFIEHVFAHDTLDDINNQAESFVVYRVSDAAARALRAHDGFDHYNRINDEVWRLARTVNLHGALRGFERLLIERDSTLRARLGPDARTTVARMDELLDDPFYRGFDIYVHKLGVKPVGFHIARLLDRNPRTPFRIELVLHNLHTTLYRRYLATRLGCDAG